MIFQIRNMIFQIRIMIFQIKKSRTVYHILEYTLRILHFTFALTIQWMHHLLQLGGFSETDGESRSA